MDVPQDRITFQCTCGFRLERVPRDVVDDLSRCLGCGRSLRVTARIGSRSLADVRDLR
jgi:hypothetical protein